MLAGGVEAPLSPLSFGAFAIIRAMSTRNADPGERQPPLRRGPRRIRHGGRRRGAAAGRAFPGLARGARIYAEVCGYGLTNDAHHMTAPRPDGRRPRGR